MSDLLRRCQELMADRATQDITPARLAELDAILVQHPEWEKEEALEFVLAEIELSLLGELEPMPVHVRNRLQQQAHEWNPPA